MGWIADLLKEIPSAARYKVELEEMEKQNATLKAENASLKSELEPLRNELAALKTSAGGLAQDAEKILAFIARNEDATAQQVARALGMSKGAADMHLEDLTTSNHIDASFVIGQEPEYYLAQTGRRYLHSKGLL